MSVVKQPDAFVKLVECPRDAMQGMDTFVPTEEKIEYLNTLLQVGFDTLDFGSFVSSKAIPQMRDTAEVLEKLDLSTTSTKLLAIVANERGAEQACAYKQITYIGFPLSLSETFQQRNTNKSIKEAFSQLETIQQLAGKHAKTLVVYLSMGFGNPYGDPFDLSYVTAFVQQLKTLGVSVICPSDTIGIATPDSIHSLFSSLLKDFPSIEFGAHLHSTPTTAFEKIDAAYTAGCRRFDGALRGFGGCPMATDKLTGNIATETLLYYAEQKGIGVSVDKAKFSAALTHSSRIF